MAVYGWYSVTVKLRCDFLSKIWKYQKHLNIYKLKLYVILWRKLCWFHWYIYLVEMKMHQCSTLKKHLTLVWPKKIKMLKFMSLDNLKYIITIIPNKYIIITKKINYYLYFTHKKFKICKKQHRFWLFCLLFICIETIEYQKILTQTMNRI